MATKCPKCQFENPDDTIYCGKCAAPLAGPQGMAISKTMTIQQSTKFMSKGSILAGKYRIIEPIGKGGMGVVYKGEDIKLERTVALKFLPAELTGDPEARERFVREAKAAAALSHPHICTVYEIGEDENQYFIAMECIEGQSLKQKILKGPIDQAEALDIAIQVAEGLEEAHKKRIIHRDIKPGNIMVTDKGTAKVMDFGLAKVFGASLITKEAKTMGTVAYMSPEQAKGEPVDQRTDLWSLGVVLYEMLTGQLPFKGEYDQSIIHSILSREPDPLTKVLPNIPKALENVVFTALAKNPVNRYQSMGELLEDFRAIAEGLKPLRARGQPLKGRILGIKKAYFYAGFIIFIALIAAAIIFLFPGRSEAFDSVAILPIINESGDPDQDPFAFGLTNLLISRLYTVAALGVAPHEAVMIYNKSDKSPEEIARELNVKALVKVLMLKQGNRVRLVSTLSDPFQKRVIWTESLERESEDIMFLQADLVQAIVNKLKVAVRPGEQALLASGRKVNPEAYDLCLQGISIWQSPREQMEDYLEFCLKALSCFEKAIELDPNLALAYAWIAEITPVLAGANFTSKEEAYPKAMAAALKALELDENLAQAHSAFGNIKLNVDWDFITAEREAKRALELEPSNHWLRLCYYDTLGILGRFDEGIEGIKPLLEEPSIRRLSITPYAHLCLAAGRYDEAIRT